MIKNNMKKALVIGLSAATLLPTATFGKTYSDVNSGNYGWASNAIDVLSDKGVIAGYEDGTFKPERPVSFEEVFQLLIQVLDPSESEIKSARDKYETIVKNAGTSDWAIKPISVALYRNILSETALKDASNKGFLGLGNNKKYPIRANIAVFFAKGLNLSSSGDESLLRHNDLSRIDSTTKGYLASLVKANVFSSTGSDGNFDGDRHIKRAEMAIITKASYDYIGKNPIKEEEMEGTVVLASRLNNVNVLILEKNNQKYSFAIDETTKYTMKDKTNVSFSDIAQGQKVKIKYQKSLNSDKEGLAKNVEIISSEQNLVGYVNSKDNNNSLTIRYRNNTNDVDLKTTQKISTSDTKTFKFYEKAKIYRYDKTINYNDINVDDLVEFKTDINGNIKEMNVYPKEFTATGRVVSISNSTTSGTIVLRMSDNKDYSFYITKDTRDLRNVNNNDNINLKVNYKVAIETTQTSNIIRGYVERFERDYRYDRNDRYDNRYYDYSDGYIRIRQDNNQYIDIDLNRDTNFLNTDVLNNPQPTRDNYLNKYVVVETYKDNYSGRLYAKNIRKASKNDNYTVKVQVINIHNLSSPFNQTTTLSYDLMVLETNNDRISRGRIIELKDYSRKLNQYAVYELKGMIESRGSNEELNNFEMNYIENPGRQIDSYNGYRGYENGRLTLR